MGEAFKTDRKIPCELNSGDAASNLPARLVVELLVDSTERQFFQSAFRFNSIHKGFMRNIVLEYRTSLRLLERHLKVSCFLQAGEMLRERTRVKIFREGLEELIGHDGSF